MLRLDTSARSWRVLAAALITARVDLDNDPDGTPAGCGGGGGDANIPGTNENEGNVGPIEGVGVVTAADGGAAAGMVPGVGSPNTLRGGTVRSAAGGMLGVTSPAVDGDWPTLIPEVGSGCCMPGI